MLRVRPERNSPLPRAPGSYVVEGGRIYIYNTRIDYLRIVNGGRRIYICIYIYNTKINCLRASHSLPLFRFPLPGTTQNFPPLPHHMGIKHKQSRPPNHKHKPPTIIHPRPNAPYPRRQGRVNQEGFGACAEGVEEVESRVAEVEEGVRGAREEGDGVESVTNYFG